MWWIIGEIIKRWPRWWRSQQVGASTVRPARLSHLVLVATGCLLVSACGPLSSTPSSSSPGRSPAGGQAGSSSSAVHTSIAGKASTLLADACKLVTLQEAEQLAHSTFQHCYTYPPGSPYCGGRNSNGCQVVYGLQGGPKFGIHNIVVVGEYRQDQYSPMANQTAVAGLGAFLGEANAATTDLTNFGDADEAQLAQATVGTFNGSGIFVHKGLVYFTIGQVVDGQPAVGSAALEAQARVSLQRLEQTVNTAPVPTPSESLTVPSPAYSAAPALDGCSLMTSQEASQLVGVGVSVGSGPSQLNGTGVCSYQSADSKAGVTLVGYNLQVDLSRSPGAEAVREIQAFTLQYGDLTATDVGTLGRGTQAGVAQGTLTIQAGSSSQATTDQAAHCSAILVAGNAVELFIVACVQGGPAPSTAALEAQAKISLGRLPSGS
jgi:hypothetical protein